ncbi:MAG: FAD-binding and (Fe-S)-binding domain-containing protein [Saprospiraceae bacterium]
MNLLQLKNNLEGELYYDQLLRVLYATDASVYRELPLAVALPKNREDLKKLIHFATENKTSLIPRAAGTSLAGQCVGNGIVVDISKYFTKILEFNKQEKWIKVQPGVVRDELNAFLKPHGLFFSPITSTANRAMIGGMVGNNSCGTTSIVYGSTREHVLEIKTILSDGSEVAFGEMTQEEFFGKLRLETLEGKLYQHIFDILQKEENKNNILTHFPKANIHRRNTGYALDYLLNSQMFSKSNEAFNFCKLLCGSEGTLAFTTEVKLHLDDLPLPYNVVLAAHFNSIDESLRATQMAMQHKPTACELMDKIILDCTKENIEQSKNRFFVEGDPQGVLMVEFRGTTILEAENQANKLIENLKKENLGYAFPIIPSEKTKQVWQLRSAGLGLLANIPGDKKAVACIEDTAVAIEDLPEYIAEFSKMMEDFGQQSVYYAHAGAGEIHLRPILNLKKSEDVEQFFQISKASAELVKKYKGSLSGEHGDGRVRAEFIPLMVGEENYQLFYNIKHTWDPNNIFNPGKIVDASPMNSSLRYESDQEEVEIKTIFDFSNEGGILRAAEKCNGSGDCRKLPVSGGTMCPSYQATRNEKDTTRGRANTLREFLTKNKKGNPFDHPEIKEVMDLCLSCKGCTSECPSNVDMSSLKAEFLHQYYQSNGIPLRAKVFAYINDLNRIGSVFPKLYNFFLTNSFFSGLAKRVLGIAPERSLPTIHSVSLRKWFQQKFNHEKKGQGTVYFFCDEFTNWNDTEIGIKSLKLLSALGYNVKIVDHPESGRAAISKGLLNRAQKFAQQNVAIFSKIINAENPLIGIEPSAILSFRDEYPRLVKKAEMEATKKLSANCFLIDEFISNEIKKGKITSDFFTKEKKEILLHGHCHQKALSNVEDTIWLLSLPENYSVEVIPSGCCGMAGSFGYEKEHFEVSQQVGNLVLFPKVKNAKLAIEIVAPGTSCRHQIFDGTGRKVKHPVEVLFEALINE